MASVAKENYLKAIYFLSSEGQPVTVSNIAQKLDVSKPTANNMIKSLEELGWLHYEKYKPIQITEEGKKAAAQVIRKHRLTEMFLHEIMGFGWEEVHEIAEEMEHIGSESLFERMDSMLGHPTVDPHGSPIPDATGHMAIHDYEKLSDIAVGSTGKLRALGESSNGLLVFLNEQDIGLGSTIELKSIHEFDSTYHIQVDDDEIKVVGKKVADNLLLEMI